MGPRAQRSANLARGARGRGSWCNARQSTDRLDVLINDGGVWGCTELAVSHARLCRRRIRPARSRTAASSDGVMVHLLGPRGKGGQR